MAYYRIEFHSPPSPVGYLLMEGRGAVLASNPSRASRWPTYEAAQSLLMRLYDEDRLPRVQSSNTTPYSIRLVS